MRDLKEIEARYRNRELPRRPHKLGWIFKKRYLLFVVLVVAFFTNPDETKHKAVVTQKASVIIPILPGSVQSPDHPYDNLYARQLVDQHISSTNLLFFSLTRARWKDNSYVVGIGIFGSVYVSGKLDELIRKQLR